MSRKINITVSALLIAINLFIAFNYFFIPVSPQSDADSNPLINNHIKDTNSLFNVIITDYSSTKVNLSLDSIAKLSYTILILFTKEIEYNLVSSISFVYNQIQKDLTLQRKAKILFPFHYYS